MSGFKTYVGTKTLKGRPMTKEEYCEYRNWTVPENEDPKEEGYLVEYLDGGKPNDDRHEGYISWSPKDVFEKAYVEVDTAKQGETFEDRLKKEFVELTSRAWKLHDVLFTAHGAFDADFRDKVGEEQHTLLNLQLNCINSYAYVLGMRLKLLGIDVQQLATNMSNRG